MSQAKVDRYKEEKRNRKQIIKKQKLEWMATKVCLSLAGLVMVAWIGVSVYSNVTAPADTASTDLPAYTINTDAIDDYMAALTVES